MGSKPDPDDHAGSDRPGIARLRASIGLASRALETLERLGMIAAGICFVAIVLITAADVAMRYVFNAPLIWAYELISDYLMVAIFFLAIAATQRLGQNIGVDILVRRLPGRGRAGLAAFNQCLIIGFVILLVALYWPEFVNSWTSNDVLAGLIPWPLWPTQLMLLIGCTLLCLRLLVELLGNLAAATLGVTELASHRQPHILSGLKVE